MKMLLATSVAAALTTGAVVVHGAPARDSKGPPGAQTAQADTKAPAPVPAEPQQTSASFGDWVVRCDRTGGSRPAKRVCEAAQSLVIKGQQAPIAQVAFGHNPADANGVLVVTVLVPTNITLDKPPRFGPGADETKGATLTFRRCVPGGCVADAKLEPALVTEARAAQAPGHLTLLDAAERTITLPVSFRGLPQALDALAKELAADAASR